MTCKRFIPAGAGNTHSFQHCSGCKPVYPRWRGEHVFYSNTRPPNHGLSPLARGTRRASFVRLRVIRFIPAGAGNTSKWYLYEKILPVYPRWRGEHAAQPIEFEKLSGLSPLARGTRMRTHLEVESRRFIPAGAGNTSSGSSLTSLSQVYPRWRGEHSKSTQLNLNTFLAHKKTTNFS